MAYGLWRRWVAWYGICGEAVGGTLTPNPKPALDSLETETSLPMLTSGDLIDL
ncbi:hypothetical protein IFR05_013307 [Cadophora sp. M221]|nr:hypothetical protein IFR05_013307 [Cadophora sp. M221]